MKIFTLTLLLIAASFRVFSQDVQYNTITTTSLDQANPTSIRILGLNDPVMLPSARNISFEFNSAGKAYIRAFRGYSWGTNLQFLTSGDGDVGGTPSVRMHIGQDGNVGIGTEGPDAKIDIRGITIKSQYGVIHPIINAFSTNDPAIGTGGVIAFGGKTGNATPEYAFAYVEGAKETIASNNYAGYFAVHTVSGGGDGEVPSANYERLRIASNGNVGIGTPTPREKLSVNGNIRSREIKVENDHWPDYVFAKSYELPSLQETEKHIKEKGHLPGIPSAEEVKTNGVDLGEMNAKLLQKIEELTLHLIRESNMNRENQELLKKQDDKIRLLSERLTQLENN